jgi:membrane protein YqaA with SNARE-associated domain
VTPGMPVGAMDAVCLVVATLIVAVGGGLVPFINVEAWLFGVSAVCPSAAFVPVVLAASLGQVAAKAVLYRVGGGALLGCVSRPRGSGLAAAIHRLEGAASQGTAVVFASALTGVPPFYLVSVAAGVVRFRFPRFLVLALVGRVLRFTLVFLLPRVVSALRT